MPTFADWCAIDIVEDGRLHRLAVEHVDPAKVKFAIEIAERYPSDPEAPGGVGEVMRTGRSNLVPEVTDEMLVAGAQDEEHLRLARALQLRSAVLVPLVARGRVHGVITWVAAESGRRYTESDVAFAEDLARRCALAIDNAELHSQTMEAADAPPARSAARPQRGCPRLGAGQLLQPGRPHRGRRRLLRRPRPGRRPAGPVRR